MTGLPSSSLTVASIASLLVLHLFGVYPTLLFLFAALKRTRRVEARGEPLRLAGLVVAHDEERVVGDSVRSLVAQEYPADRFAVFVVADHCTDGTARVAREAGAKVLERSSGRAEGKPAAVAHGVRAVDEAGGFDAVVVFDADNQVARDFFARIAERLNAGDRVVQGLVDAKNPTASWVAASSALGFWAIAAMAQEPRERLGLSVPLMGTGFAMRLDVARRYLEGGGSLTDDLELGARLVLDGLRVAHAPDARTLDEKPVLLGTAFAQRKRWMQGRWAVAERYIPRLLRGAVRGGGGFVKVDLAFQLLAPSLLFAGVAVLFATLVAALLEHFRAIAGTGGFLGGSAIAGAVYFLLPALGIARLRVPAFAWFCYPLQPLYLALSFPLAVSGWLSRRRRAWWRTPKGDGAR